MHTLHVYLLIREIFFSYFQFAEKFNFLATSSTKNNFIAICYFTGRMKCIGVEE